MEPCSQLSIFYVCLLFIFLYICSTYCDACVAPKVVFLVCEYPLLILLLISASHWDTFGGINMLVIKDIRSHLLLITVISNKRVSRKTWPSLHL